MNFQNLLNIKEDEYKISHNEIGLLIRVKYNYLYKVGSMINDPTALNEILDIAPASDYDVVHK